MDLFAPGVYESEHFYEILKILFTEEEARLCSQLPLNLCTAEKISKIWDKSLKETLSILNTLASKGLVLEDTEAAPPKYTPSIPVLGFFEFSLMRTDGKFDRKILSELYHKYMNLDDGFTKKYSNVSPPLTRVFAHEDMFQDLSSEILPYEKVSHVIDTATCITVGTCFCRHKMEHLGLACDNPQDVCLTFNSVAKYVAKHGIAREISKVEAHQILDLCIKKGLVQIGDNTKSQMLVICNCCGCCCDLLLGYKKFKKSGLVCPSNFIAFIEHEICQVCGNCLKKCPVNAIRKTKNTYVVDKDVCLGCGVCARFCPSKACKMKNRPKKHLTPNDFVERTALWALYQGKIGNFLFDNQASLTHKLLRNLLNSIIRLPLIRSLMRNQKFSSMLINAILRSKY